MRIITPLEGTKCSSKNSNSNSNSSKSSSSSLSIFDGIISSGCDANVERSWIEDLEIVIEDNVTARHYLTVSIGPTPYNIHVDAHKASLKLTKA